MLDMHTPLSLNLRQWFSIGVVTYLLTYLLKVPHTCWHVIPCRGPLVGYPLLAALTCIMAVFQPLNLHVHSVLE